MKLSISVVRMYELMREIEAKGKGGTSLCLSVCACVSVSLPFINVGVYIVHLCIVMVAACVQYSSLCVCPLTKHKQSCVAQINFTLL